MVRGPVVAGQFYPSDKDALVKELNSFMTGPVGDTRAVGAIVPHAGYMFSGAVAGEVYSRLAPRKTFIILSPNHTGYGSRFAADSEDWDTPLGRVRVDSELLHAILGESDLITDDGRAHAAEHSIEVQLPFIQMISPAAEIVPITLQRGNIFELEEIAAAISEAMKKTVCDAMIIASSDMTHYESRASARVKDEKALKAVLAMDPEGLLNTVESENITMCGYIPSAVMLLCAKRSGASRGKLIRYSDSGDITGETDQVVGYAGVIVY